MSKAQARSALTLDLFADAARKQKIKTLSDPLQVIARHVDFDRLTQAFMNCCPEVTPPVAGAHRTPLRSWYAS